MPSESLERVRRYRDRLKADRDRCVDYIIDGVEVGVTVWRRAGLTHVVFAMTMDTDTESKLEMVASEKMETDALPEGEALAAVLRRAVDDLRLEYSRLVEPRLRWMEPGVWKNKPDGLEDDIRARAMLGYPIPTEIKRQLPKEKPADLDPEILEMVGRGYKTAADITERLADDTYAGGAYAADIPSRQTVSRRLSSLVKDERLKRMGWGQDTRYYPGPMFALTRDLEADILAMVGLGYDTVEDITERLADDTYAGGAPSQQTVFRRLGSLFKDGRLGRTGKGPGAQYYAHHATQVGHLESDIARRALERLADVGPTGEQEVQTDSASLQMEADIDDLRLERKEVEHGYDTAVDILAQLAHWDDPLLWAKIAVYNALGKTDRPGHVLYDVPLPDGTRIDFTVLIPGEPRVVLEVQDGLYERRDGHWYRVGPTGEQEVGDPTIAASNNARTLHKYLKSKRPDNRGPYVVPVLLFPDMPAGHALEDFVFVDDSWKRRVVVCGTEDLVDRILDRVHKVHTRIHSSSILSEADCDREEALLLRVSYSPGYYEALAPEKDAQRPGPMFTLNEEEKQKQE